MGATGEGTSWFETPALLVSGLLVLALLFISLCIFLIKLKKSISKGHERIMEEFKDKNIIYSDKFANFFGIKSAGAAQIRGNGILVLTEDELFFKRLMPDMEMRIPRKKIKNIEFPKSFLGKSVFKPLLKITYETESGTLDEAAWYTRKLGSLKQILTDSGELNKNE